jgi:hypothetical protein
MLETKFDDAEGDWTGLSDKKKRKQLQNRINQRHRREQRHRLFARHLTEPIKGRESCERTSHHYSLRKNGSNDLDGARCRQEITIVLHRPPSFELKSGRQRDTDGLFWHGKQITSSSGSELRRQVAKSPEPDLLLALCIFLRGWAVKRCLQNKAHYAVGCELTR